MRRAQKKILMRMYFKNGELYDIMNRRAFCRMSERLTEKYFHMSGPAIYEEMADLYKVYLCLAPLLQKQKNSFKIDWTKGHALSYIRRLFNNRVKHWYYLYETLPRRHDPDVFVATLRNNHITDSTFINYALEKYLCFWDADGRKGSLANCIFDPFFFNVKGSGLRIENTLITTSMTKKQSFVSIYERPLEIMCYKISVLDRDGKGYVDIRFSEAYLKGIKERLINAVNGKYGLKQKLMIITSVINSLLEDAKYAKDAFEQIHEMQRYFVKHTKKLAAQNSEFRHVCGSIVAEYIQKTVKFSIRANNFFWDKDHNAVPEKIYMIYYSPYREKI